MRASQKANEDLLDELISSNIFNYTMYDSVATFSLVESICTGLLKKYRVVLTSMGPKILSLCCFLVAVRHPEMSVWRVSPGAHGDVIDRNPSDTMVILETDWSER